MKLSVQQVANRLFMTAVPLLGESAHVVISGNAAYQWEDNEAGLSFLIPLFLSPMNDNYATGIVHATNEMIADGLPGELQRELMEKSAG